MRAASLPMWFAYRQPNPDANSLIQQSMDNPFFERPILNSPYEYPNKHWELDATGQPTQKVVENRRSAEFITPIPRAKKHVNQVAEQALLLFDEGKGLSSAEQQYDHMALINGVRMEVDKWRDLPNPAQWQVTPETARLLQHWRNHKFNGIRPFFCQVEAVETAIWLTEVAPRAGKAGTRYLEHLTKAKLTTEGLAPRELGVFVRDEEQLDRAQSAVVAAGLSYKKVDEHQEPTSGHVSISTMHRAKGLEFRAVAVMACDDEVIPLQSRIESVTDEADLEEVYETERHLLYVACTRARDRLMISAVDPASEFLDDLDE